MYLDPGSIDVSTDMNRVKKLYTIYDFIFRKKKQVLFVFSPVYDILYCK